MFQLSNLIKNLENELKKNDISESISLRISNLPNFDLQIDNLVKYQKTLSIEKIEKSLMGIIENEPIVKNSEISDNYFINLEIDIEIFIREIKDVKKQIKTKDPKTVILDYGGPNIGKPLHVGHLRSLNIGRSLYHINKLAGHNVLNDIHLGDWGMPIAQIISFINENSINIDEIKIADLEKIYPKASKQYLENEDFKVYAQKTNKDLNENKKEVIEKWNKLKSISVDSIRETLSILNHDFDLWIGESDVNHLIPQMIKKLIKERKIILDDGAYVSKLETNPKILITKSDGSYLYLTTDLATVLDRIDKYKVDRTLYIVDKRQSLHFEQLFKTIDFFQFSDKEYLHVEFGTVNDPKGNPFKTRDGDTKKLNDLFEETLIKIKSINKELDHETSKSLANTVLTFSDLITNRRTDYKFDLDKFTNISGKTGIYVQYAYVRANKLIKDSNEKIEKIKLEFSELDSNDLSLLKGFIKFEHNFNQALINNEPHHLADYLYEISNLFNSSYQSVNILENKNKAIKLNKLKIAHYFLDYSKLIMNSLGIEPVEKM